MLKELVKIIASASSIIGAVWLVGLAGASDAGVEMSYVLPNAIKALLLFVIGSGIVIRQYEVEHSND